MSTKVKQKQEALEAAEYQLGVFLTDTFQHLEDLKGVNNLTPDSSLYQKVYETGIWFARWMKAQERNNVLATDLLDEGNEWLNKLRDAHTEACRPVAS